ncbi:class E vacuolar protein-sorting machinery protein hse1-like [Melanaphis sacchari]|uniref:class E vacuolar protein-sorting machinery protein hse1-like n=1 Tax=Melanaphis sacchari TaxID=742174 RepID=UPI000DC13EA0|nr:class E vacuolar protein-sorting machinery protein hse1-like [Melanaphis sacchari]
MKSSFYVALVLFVTVVTADDSRSKKEAIYNHYGQITDANKYLAGAPRPANIYDYQRVPYNSYQPAAYNQLQYYQQQPYQRVGAGGYPYGGYTAATGYNQYNQYNQYPYSGGFQQYPYNVNQQYPYNVNQQYPYNANQQYPYNVNQQYPYNVNHPQHYGYQNAYGLQPNPFGYSGFNAYNFNHALRQAPAYPSAGAQPISPPVPHPFYHTQGTYYPTTIEANKPPQPPAAVAAVDPPTKPHQ